MADESSNTFWTALCRNGRQWLDRLNGHIAAVQADGDEAAVHGLRVASRRLTEPLLLLETADGKRARRVRRSLKRLRGAFGTLRDIDVLMQSLRTDPPAVPISPETRGRLEATLADQRQQAWKRAIEKCPGDVCQDVADDLDTLFSPAREPRGELSESALSAMVAQRVQAVLEADPRRDGEPDLHESRIAVKRLRYCGELAAKVMPQAGAAWIERLTEFQRMLGEWNDHVVAAQRVAKEAGRREHLACRTAYSAALLQYAAGRAATAEDLRRRVIDQWPGLAALLTGDAQPPARPRLAVSA